MAYDVALPEEDSRTVADYLDALKRRRKPAIRIAVAMLVLGVAGVILWPNSYTSKAVILIEEPEIPPGLVPSTVTTVAAQQVQYISQRVTTRTNLAQIIEKFDLFAQERKYLPTLMLVDDVQKKIRLDVVDIQAATAQSSLPVPKTIAFTLSFTHEKPDVARAVDNELVSLFLGENVRVRTEQTAGTRQFMQSEVDRLDKEMKALGEEISEFKRKNEGALPDMAMVNRQMVQRLDDELLDVGRQLKSNQDSRILLEAQLATVQPTQPRLLSDGKPIVSPVDQLKALQTQLSVAEGRYSPDHPDVLRLKRDIAAVKAQLGGDVEVGDTAGELAGKRTDLAKAQERYGPDHPEVQRLQREVASLEARAKAPKSRLPAGVEPDNPAYITIQAQLNTIKADDGALEAKAQTLRARIAEVERKLATTAEVERGLMDLARRLDTATKSYQEARAKLNISTQGQALESESKGERFTLVEPPDLPLVPSSPNRPFWLALLVVLTLGASLGWPQLAETLDHSIHGARALERVQGTPPIAEIPLLENEEDRQLARRGTALLWAGVSGVVVVALLLIHFLWIHLDVLWYVGLRKLGI